MSGKGEINFSCITNGRENCTMDGLTDFVGTYVVLIWWHGH